MKGYVYLDADGFLNQKTYDYITNINPGFFFENKEYILKYWYFDTDDKTTLRNMLAQMKDLQVRPDIVSLFRHDIGIPIDVTKTGKQ